MVRVLERLGHTVDFPVGQTCCGQMHWNTGYQEEALPLLGRFVEQFKDSEAVVSPSTSCIAMMRDHYPIMAERLKDEKLKAEVAALLPKVWEFSEFLTQKLGLEDVGAYYPHRVTYHASCHGLRSLHIGDGPMHRESRTVLRIWRNIRHQERRGFERDAGGKDPRSPEHAS